MELWTQSEKNIWVAAHRGWCEKYPENTMPAFEKAIELGVDQIETDLRVTKDGHVVLMHDADVSRTTDGEGNVWELTLDEIRKLDAGSKKSPEFKGCKVPTLDEFLALIKQYPTMTVDFEFKNVYSGVDEETGNAYIEKILAAIDEAGVTERCVINSFTAPIHEYIQDRYPGKYKHHVFWPDKNNLRATRDSYSYAYCCCLFAGGDKLLPAEEVFDFMRHRNIQPWAGASINCDERVGLAIDRGCTLITCNNPDVILDSLRRRGYHK